MNDEKQKRLAEALRENLKKRKAQVRQRQNHPTRQPEPGQNGKTQNDVTLNDMIKEK